MIPDDEFAHLVAEAEQQEFSGWNFSFLANRYTEAEVSWDYRQRVLSLLPSATSLLDMHTGGGEFLSSLEPLPPTTCATEAYPPNVPVATARLAPLGIQVVQTESDETLPFEDATFDLVINRHGGFYAPEIYRILKAGGRFISQQVGSRNNVELNQAVGDEGSHAIGWTLDTAVQHFQQAGFTIVDQQEEFPPGAFHDIGAVIFYLNVISWQIPGFHVERYRDRLAILHRRVKAEGPLQVHTRRYLIEAAKP